MTDRIHFETLGCRLNHDETEGAARFFSNAGFSIDMEILTSASPPSPETVLAVINTCTVTGKAEQKARRLIRLMLARLPAALIVVTGCYADMDASAIRSIDPGRISIIPGTAKYILSLLPRAMQEGGPLSLQEGRFRHELLDAFIRQSLADSVPGAVFGGKKRTPVNAFLLYTNVFEKHSRASIKIQDGCNSGRDRREAFACCCRACWMRRSRSFFGFQASILKA